MRRPLLDKHGNVRELQDDDIREMCPAAEVLPAEFVGVLPTRRPGERGPGKRPPKRLVTLRLDPDVLEHFRATGPGWQSRMNEALRKAAGKA
ncbi:MAG TPA: BrnA antitoxin family protein [Afifellaceae bacterium]|nr:BrnA antitoxin family protein [Afifellaceae bacterium]